MTKFQRLAIALATISTATALVSGPRWVTITLAAISCVVLIFFVRELIKLNQQNQSPEYKPKIIGVKGKHQG